MEDQPTVFIETPRLILTIPPLEAAPRVVQFFQENREYFAPWDSLLSLGYFTEAYWHEQLAVARQEFINGASMRLFLFRRREVDGAVIGKCNFTQFVRGSFQACYLGYSLDEQASGQGFMTEALHAAIAYAFETLALHRIMANYVPTNEQSGKLLRRLGFVVEGYARNYLFINGAWQDHILTALTNPSPYLPKIISPQDAVCSI